MDKLDSIAEPLNTHGVGVSPAIRQSAGRQRIEQIELIAVAPESIL